MAKGSAPKPIRINPVLDFSFGVAFAVLIALFFKHALDVRAEKPNLLPTFGGCVLLCIFAIIATRKSAVVIGRVLSRLRTSESVPADCRDPLGSDVAMHKWQDQAWQGVVHVTMGLCEIRLLLANPEWWKNPRDIGCPGTYAVSVELETFAILQLSLWIITGISCKFFEERRKDYVEMMAHHVVTVALVLTALAAGDHAFLLVVLAVHDISDVFLDIMKMANYLKVEDKHGCFITEVAFVVNTYISWPYLRLYVFPFFIIPGVFFGYQEKCVEAGWQPTLNIAQVPLWITLRTAGLSTLAGLHCFWFYLLNRIAYKLVSGQNPNEAGDEEYEITMKDGEGESQQKKKKDT